MSDEYDALWHQVQELSRVVRELKSRAVLWCGACGGSGSLRAGKALPVCPKCRGIGMVRASQEDL